jgi:uncharacterized repeat protein (TIGR01451 family)
MKTRVAAWVGLMLWTSGALAGLTENFDASLFPPAGWTNAGAVPELWSRHTVSAYGAGTAAARANFYSIYEGTGSLETATFAPAAAGEALGFDYAYATYAGEADRLVVQASTNGGATYAEWLDMPGGATGVLNTAGIRTGSFVPTASEWRTWSVPLAPGVNRLRFDAITAYGNNLYLDNVHIYDGTQAADLVLAMSAAPDPVAVGSNLTYSILVSNAGPAAAAGVFLTNQCPSGAVWVSTAAGRGAWTTNGEFLVGDLGPLAVGETETLTVVVQPSVQGFATNRAEVVAATFDPQPANNRRTTATHVSQVGGDLFFRTNEFFLCEDRGSVTLTVFRTGGVVGAVACTYETVDGTATAGSDYAARSGTLIFSNNSTTALLTIPILNDAEAEAEEAFTVRLGSPTGGAVLAEYSHLTVRIHDDDGLATVPFAEDFETGVFSNHWAFYSGATTGPQITTDDGPRSGARHVNINGVPLTYSLNELTLSADLAGREGVNLRFWHKRYRYETANAMSDSFQNRTYADGVAISVDGTQWFKVHGLGDAETGTNEYRQFEVALDPILAARGLVFTDRVRIRFQSYGYYNPPNYGRFFDDIELYTSPGSLRLEAAQWTVAEGTGAVTVAVERVQGDSGEVRVDFATLASAAETDVDFSVAAGTLVFSNGVRRQTFAVPILQDGVDEPLEDFFVLLSNPQGGAALVAPTQAVVWIEDDDGPGEVEFAAAQFVEVENNGLAAIGVVRRFGTNGAVAVGWRTEAGTATPGADYVESAGEVHFADGQAEAVFEIPLLDDALQEGPETIHLLLEAPTGGAVLDLLTNAVLTLLDDEAPRAAFPFYEGFESGVWSNTWSLRTNGTGRIQLTNPANGFEGSRSLAMDAAAGWALNEATLTVDLSGQTSVIFRCWARDYGDQPHSMPESFTGSTNADGVAVSSDGVVWHRLVDLAGAGSHAVYTNWTVDLAAFAAERNLPLTETFQLRFQQYDDGAFPARGRSFDHVSLSPAPPVPSTVLRAQGFEGGPDDTWDFRIVPGTGQVAVTPERKSAGNRSLRLTGSNRQNADPYAEFENVSIGGHNHVRVSVAFSASGVDTDDDLYLELSYDNGATWSSVKLVDGYSNADIPFGGTNANNPTTVSNNPWTAAVPAGRTQVKARIRFDERSGSYNNSADHYFVDGLSLYYLPTNQPPAIEPLPDRTALVSNLLAFAVVATDIDSNVVTLAAANLPDGALFPELTGPAPLTNWFEFIPESGQADVTYPVIFTATDGDGVNVQTVAVRVLDRVVTFSTNRLFAEENGGPVSLGVRLSRAADAVVPLAVSGRAVPDADYQLSSTTLTFAVDGPAEQWLTITPLDDEDPEGPETIRFAVAANPETTPGDGGAEIILRDDDSVFVAAANLTSGGTAIYLPPGERILEALNADVVAIQEFNVTDSGGPRAFVDRIFGTNFFFFVEPTGNLPNGVISRWPILAAGEWPDPQVNDRDFVWATVAVPGGRPLHVISVHLHASGGVSSREIEARLLTNYIAQAGYHPADLVVVGGDLNTQNRSEAAFQVLRTQLADNRVPSSQDGDPDTNQPRNKPYDVVLPVPYLNARHLPVHFGGLVFSEGLLFDTRLWDAATLPYPAQVGDSAALSMQHMAVAKLFSLDRFVTLLVRAGAHGSASVANAEVGLGSNLTVALTAEPYYHVAGATLAGARWTPSGQAVQADWTWLDARSNAWLDVDFAANLAPRGTPEWWLAEYGLSNDFATAEESDLDEDGQFAWQEFRANTRPDDPFSLFQFEEARMASAGDRIVLRWQSASNRTYAVWRSLNLTGAPAQPLATNLPGDPPMNTYTDAVADAATRFYWIQVEP